MAKKTNIEIQVEAQAKLRAKMERLVIDSNLRTGQELFRKHKITALTIQDRLNKAIDRPTAFTQNAVGTRFVKINDSKYEMHTFIKNQQFKYLAPILLGKTEQKFKPTSNANINNFGNIQGLRQNRFEKFTMRNGVEALKTKGSKPKIVAIKGRIDHTQHFDFPKTTIQLMQNMIRNLRNK